MTSWQQLGGVNVFYPLQRECAQRQLQLQRGIGGAPKEFQLGITGFIHGPGLVLAMASCEEDAYKLWLFPDQQPNYLKYVNLLQFLQASPDITTRMLCWKSTSDPASLFLVEIQNATCK